MTCFSVCVLTQCVFVWLLSDGSGLQAAAGHGADAVSECSVEQRSALVSRLVPWRKERDRPVRHRRGGTIFINNIYFILKLSISKAFYLLAVY